MNHEGKCRSRLTGPTNSVHMMKNEQSGKPQLNTIIFLQDTTWTSAFKVKLTAMSAEVKYAQILSIPTHLEEDVIIQIAPK